MTTRHIRILKMDELVLTMPNYFVPLSPETSALLSLLHVAMEMIYLYPPFLLGQIFPLWKPTLEEHGIYYVIPSEPRHNSSNKVSELE
jgi:hypothetical protein